jgi:hypothetical protein
MVFIVKRVHCYTINTVLQVFRFYRLLLFTLGGRFWDFYIVQCT